MNQVGRSTVDQLEKKINLVFDTERQQLLRTVEQAELKYERAQHQLASLKQQAAAQKSRVEAIQDAARRTEQGLRDSLIGTTLTEASV